MSNIYIQEPPTYGKVLLKTTVGDIDIELWSKEAPKACRNFVQLCMEGYYNGTIFHRIVKEFIAQGGDPTGTGEGGESIWGQPFKDEFHSRLRFCRRGLVAMANSGKDDNGSQFFFTLGPTQELQNKHTIFGKVTGETVYNMLKLADGDVDQNERPEFPQKITKTVILNNPFDDIVPRVQEKSKRRKKEKKAGVKDFKLLSFGEQAEEDEMETERENKKFSGKSKSTHDLLDDPKLSSQPAVETKPGAEESDSDLSGDEETKDNDDQNNEGLNKIRSKLAGKKSAGPSEPKKAKDEDEEPDVEYVLGQDEREARKKKAEALREEYDALRKSMKKPKEKVVESDEGETESQVVIEYKKEKEEFESKKKQLPKKGHDREAFTMALLAKFQKKLGQVKETVNSDEEEQQQSAQPTNEPDVADSDFGKDDGQWMSRKLQFQQLAPILAKDASAKDDKASDWYDINDPRNPINQRRREGHKQSRRK
ncbi:Hypothetical predicted protein [Cloeon dipterum]|uniref:Spliceosome-associated protein CWC27 homolog n=2 Tax=Cloeon dipterum TaxID=197152 RepID=A0A8S1CIB5_9INSE|nr:Hypothetical predicted protein [Cloeon dipterum]